MAIIQIQFRRDTTIAWSGSNPILASGEPAYDITLGIYKIGDGITPYNSLISYTSANAPIDWVDVNGIPTGIISGSSQLTSSLDVKYELQGTGILSGSHIDIANLNTFTSSFQTKVNELSAQTSSYLTSSVPVDYIDINNVPINIVSGSSQLTSSLDVRYELSGALSPISGSTKSLIGYWYGTTSEYDNLSEWDNNTLYFTSD